MYDARERAIRDHQSAINSARREGREVGEQIGQERGEQIGEQRGTLMEKIIALQEILGQTPMDTEILRVMSTNELETLASQLQQSVRSRPAS